MSRLIRGAYATVPFWPQHPIEEYTDLDPFNVHGLIGITLTSPRHDYVLVLIVAPLRCGWVSVHNLEIIDA